MSSADSAESVNDAVTNTVTPPSPTTQSGEVEHGKADYPTLESRKVKHVRSGNVEVLQHEPGVLHSFPRSLYPEGLEIWPVSKHPGHFAPRGAWSARLASLAWRDAQRDGKWAALADPALFTGAVLDSALERLHTQVRPAVAAMEDDLHFLDWVDETDDAIGAALDAAVDALPCGVSPPDFFSAPFLGRFVRAVVDWHWRASKDSHGMVPPEMRDKFRRTPNFDLLGRFDVANNAEAHAIAEELYREAAARNWERASPRLRALFDPAHGTFDDDVATDAHEIEEQWDEPELRRDMYPPVLSMGQMQDLLYRESKGERTALRDYLGLKS